MYVGCILKKHQVGPMGYKPMQHIASIKLYISYATRSGITSKETHTLVAQCMNEKEGTTQVVPKSQKHENGANGKNYVNSQKSKPTLENNKIRSNFYH